MIDGEADSHPAPQLDCVFEFQHDTTGHRYGVSMATLLQCLCIAEQLHRVPPLEPTWEALTLPPSLRELSRLKTD